MFVDLMNDIYSTFTERFLKVQLMFEPPDAGDLALRGGGLPSPHGDGNRVKKRYNALGILEEVSEESIAATNGDGNGTANGNGNGAGTGVEEVMDIAADEPPKTEVVTRRDPVVVGAGRARPLSANSANTPVDWSNVGRNDPCPCGSGKKFKKCHGA